VIKLFKAFNGLILPNKHICLFCRENNSNGKEFICKECKGNLDFVNKEVSIDSPYIKFVYFSLLYNRFVREMMKEYKFNGKNYLYKPFAEMMVKTIYEKGIDKNIDLIAYIPTHRRKKALRGYNQAELLARHISETLNIPLLKDNLIKIKWTNDQSHLDKIGRLKNLEDSFCIKEPNEIYNKKILLIDDVITTGTTMIECSKVLINNKAKKVIGLALTSSKTN